MKRLTLSLAIAALVSAPVNAVQVEGNKLILAPDEVQACAEQGGCALLTRAQFQAEMAKAFEAGRKATKEQCGMNA